MPHFLESGRVYDDVIATVTTFFLHGTFGSVSRSVVSVLIGTS